MNDSTTQRGAELLIQAEHHGLDQAAHDGGAHDFDNMRKYLNSDLFAFAHFIFGYKDLIPTLHGDLAAWIADWGWCILANGERKYFTDISSTDRIVLDNRRIMTQIPREFFKTSMGTRANALWQICREPHLPVAIFNERQENAQRWMRGIRDVIQGSKLFQQLYRDLLPPGIHYSDTRTTPRYWKWSDSELDLGGKDLGEVEPSISAHGIESASTGGHWPKLILDDLISMKHKLSIVEMERAREWIRNHIYLMRPAERSLSYINCTPWTYTDIYRDCLADYGYRLYRRAALETAAGEPDVAAGESIFPQKLSTATLRSMHKRDPFSFNAQMQCIPQPGKEQSFNQEHIRTGSMGVDQRGEPVFVIDDHSYDPKLGAIEGDINPPKYIPLYLMDKAILLDPAPSEETDIRKDPRARNGILVVGIDCYDRRYILESWADRAPYMDVLDKVFQLSTKWNTDRLFCEEVNFSNVYRHWVARETERDGRYPGHNLHALPLYPKGREKHARIRATTLFWTQGLMYVNTDECGQFLVELSEYPNSETVDLMDCMGYIKDCIHRPLNTKELEQQRRIQRRGAPYSDSYYKGMEDY